MIPASSVVLIIEILPGQFCGAEQTGADYVLPPLSTIAPSSRVAVKSEF